MAYTDPRSRWVDLGIPVRYLDFGGPPGAPVIVAVHGLGGAAINWLAIAPALTVLVAAVGFGRFHLLLALILIGIVALTGALVLEAGAVLAENSEIMVGVLEVILGLDPVARELGVARQALVLLEQLGGVAALAVVLAIARLSAEIGAPLSSAAAPAAALSLIDQMPTSLRSVFCPSAMGQQGRRQRRRLLTLSFRSLRACVWRSADCVGGGRDALSTFLGERARPCQ